MNHRQNTQESVANGSIFDRLGLMLSALWNYGLEPSKQIILQVRWPLYFVPLVILNQLLTPHPVWITLLIVLVGLYGFSYWWIRLLARPDTVDLQRTRQGTVLVAGDVLEEEFVLQNQSPIPALWATFFDFSELPEYRPGQVLACGSFSTYKWRASYTCQKRGLYRLGPHQLQLGDPLGLFRLDIKFDHHETLVIYPRVAQLPRLSWPQGHTDAKERRHRPLRGTLRSPSVREYRAGDSLRYLHWPTTAHRGRLMVTELAIEPTSDVWIVLDLDETGHYRLDSAEPEDKKTPSWDTSLLSRQLNEEDRHSFADAYVRDSLEYGIVVAASLASELLHGTDRRAVGLFAISNSETVLVSTQVGQAHLWQILGALAPIQMGTVSLAQLLRSNREILGRGRTIVVVTAQRDLSWAAELLHVQALGVESSVVWIDSTQTLEHQSVEMAEENVKENVHENIVELLAASHIPVQTLSLGTPLPTLTTQRRTRKLTRTTPSGGVVTVEIEEDV
ncbi:MAG: DUF58 domain-containing protein [Chloroflexota bacterium]